MLGEAAGDRVSTSVSSHIQIGFSTLQVHGTITRLNGPLSSSKMSSPPQTPPDRPSGKTPTQEVPFWGVVVGQNSGTPGNGTVATGAGTVMIVGAGAGTGAGTTTAGRLTGAGTG